MSCVVLELSLACHGLVPPYCFVNSQVIRNKNAQLSGSLSDLSILTCPWSYLL